jgi:hypothetical protein
VKTRNKKENKNIWQSFKKLKKELGSNRKKLNMFLVIFF